jgi:hypothetical protein
VSKGDEQNNALQAKALRAAGCRRLFEEAASGGRWDRPELHRMLDHLREGDTVVVWKLDRLSRSLKDVLHIMERIAEAGAGFRSVTENIDTTTPEAGEAGCECNRIKQPENPAEGVVAGNAVLEGEKLPQERLFCLTEQRHVGAILAAAQHGAQRNHQNLMQVMAGIVLPRIGELGKAGGKLFHRAASGLNPTLGIHLPLAPQPRHG